MLSPQLRSKVHQLWTMFWSAGMTNPLVAIEQITYLLFLRQLERLDHERTRAGKASIYTPRPNAEGIPTDYAVCRWSHLRRHVSFELLNQTVFPWLRGLERWLLDEKRKADEAKRAAAAAASTPGDETIGATEDLLEITGRLDDAFFQLDANKTATLTNAVATIDDLFRAIDTRSANADIMGDVFEHLLDEIQSSGKNGQFRTPRQIIRFMVELLDPAPGARVLDPACGTGGFLINTLLHWRRRATAPENVILEWDGTPHRCYGGDAEIEDRITDDCFQGSDNDRTMVRVAWMNLILHGVEFPRVKLLDSLSKRLPDAASGTYDCIFANPPFSGSVDRDDLSPVAARFPRGKGGKPLTTDTELLFLWLILDLLKPGGRAAVIVPDGVLFGSTNAHHRLRRDLLWEHTLEAVVSLPGGVFLPYAGVKTSILVFQKAGETKKPGDDPRTREVWFYEVADEAFTLDQKRKARLLGPNDLCDALEKFRTRDTSNRYFQPQYRKERWRQVDDAFLRVFPEHATQQGALLGVQEIFRELPANPEAQVAKVSERWELDLAEVIRDGALGEARREKGSEAETLNKRTAALATTVADRLRKKVQAGAVGVLDLEFEKHGLNALRACIEAAAETAQKSCQEPDFNADDFWDQPTAPEPELVAALAKAFAMLDGFDVWLRTTAAFEQEAKNEGKPQLSWLVPVRRWAAADNWGEPPEGVERVNQPTHDGPDPRPDYLAWLRDTLEVFEEDGTVRDRFRDRLEPACIEAADLNLSAGRYKPADTTSAHHRPPGELIRELQSIHDEVRERLGTLLALVEGRSTVPPGVSSPGRVRRKITLT